MRDRETKAAQPKKTIAIPSRDMTFIFYAEDVAGESEKAFLKDNESTTLRPTNIRSGCSKQVFFKKRNERRQKKYCVYL